MADRSATFHFSGLAGFLFLAVLLVLAWWFFSALLSITLGQLLLLGAAGLVGFAIGRAT